MRNALQDQLLKAGLVNDKQVKKAQVQKRKEDQHNKGVKPVVSEEEAKRQALQAQAEKTERDRQLNLQRNEAAEQKAIVAQIKQLVETHRRPIDDGDIPYNFIDDGKVKTLRVSEETRKQIARGALAIVKLANRYELVPAEIADKIRVRNPAFLVVDNAQPQLSTTPAAEDPYAQYQIPDDLVW